MAHYDALHKGLLNITTDNRVLAEMLAEEGGFSIDKNGLPPMDGFMVGVEGSPELKIPNCPGINLAAFIKAYRDAWGQDAAERGLYIGGWFDENEGCYYLDISERFENRVDAEIACKERGEIAYYDVEKECSVTV
jgi:hypothetical protein